MYQEPQAHYGTQQSHRVRNAQPAHKCRSKKIGFSSRNVARKDRLKQRNRGCSVQREYLCDECKHWHLTSQEDDTYDSKGRDTATVQRAGKAQKRKRVRKTKYKADYGTMYRKKG